MHKLLILKTITMAKKDEIKGYVVYEGASMINGAPIVGIVTIESKNIKTGNMANLWILHAEIKPNEAVKSGDDSAVCGECPLRRFSGGACYVLPYHAPLSVFKSWKRGNYSKIDSYEVFEGLKMRFGAYGDPLALPTDILVGLKSVVKNNTSYTHQWETENSQIVKNLTMASVETVKQAKVAQSKGWRTFRVIKKESQLMDNEIMCPNYTHGVKCIDCNLCNGASSKAKNIAIVVHGAKAKKFDF